jgi:hypothetical protein
MFSRIFGRRFESILDIEMELQLRVAVAVVKNRRAAIISRKKANGLADFLEYSSGRIGNNMQDNVVALRKTAELGLES